MKNSKEINWATIYKSLAKELPAVSENDLDAGIFRDLFLKWGDLPTESSNGEKVIPMALCCDVLEIDSDYYFDTGLIIFARRIELTEYAALLFDRTEGNTQEILIFAQEVVSKKTGELSTLKVSTLWDGEEIETYSFNGNNQSKQATGFFWDARERKPTPMKPSDLEGAYFYEAEPLRLNLRSLFQVATLLMTEEIELSILQLRWIASLAQASPDAQYMAAEAHAFAATLKAMQAIDKEALLVPRLDAQIYASKAENLMELLKTRQQKWSEFQGLLQDASNWKNVAEDAIKTETNQLSLTTQLVAQAENTQKQMLSARNIAVQQLQKERDLVISRKFAFDAGIKAWETTNILKESFQLAFNVIGGVTDIVMAVVTSPKPKITTKKVIRLKTDSPLIDRNISLDIETSTNNSLQTINGMLEGITLPDEVSALGDIFNNITQIVSTIQMADKIEGQSNQILDAITNTVGSSFSTIELSGLDAVTGGAHEWDLLSNNIEAVFENISILKEIEGGEAYRLEVQQLIVYGRAFSQARLAVANANTQLAEMKWRREAAKKNIEVAQARLENLKERIVQDQTFAQIIFGKMLDTKRSIYLAMESYCRAFQYFTLVSDDSLPKLPKITDSFDEFQESVVNISGKSLLIENLSPQPGEMLNREILITDESVLEQLRVTGKATWKLEVKDTTVFNCFSRIRCDCINVFVEGLAIDDEDIFVKIKTSGVYTDKLLQQNNTKRFVGECVEFGFVYKNNAAQDIAMNAQLPEHLRNYFFKPTPFTIWSFEIKYQKGDKIDFNAIENLGLRIKFQGVSTVNDYERMI